MSIPLEPVAVPAMVSRLAGGAQLIPVWRNGHGGLTFRTDDGRYIRWGPYNPYTSFTAEAERLAWAAPFTPVPRVLELGGDEVHEWCVTVALPGLSAVDPRWRAEPAVAVRALGEALRALHDALPVADCPFDWGVDKRAADAAARGILIPPHLRTPPEVDRLVVCHGDACAPNTLIGDDGTWTGHVDLGALGVADRWADIAVAAMSTEWNYGPGWEDALVEAYGLAPDALRMTYYQELWNST